MQELDLIILVVLSGISMSENNTKEDIKQAVIDAVNDSKDTIISQITDQKRTMFDDNSHAWSPLLPQTIARKKREKGLFRSPESINIRKGDLFKAFTNTGSYKAQKGGSPQNERINFDIELDDDLQAKTNVVASHGRDVVDVTQTELNQITDTLVNVIAKTISHKAKT